MLVDLDPLSLNRSFGLRTLRVTCVSSLEHVTLMLTLLQLPGPLTERLCMHSVVGTYFQLSCFNWVVGQLPVLILFTNINQFCTCYL